LLVPARDKELGLFSAEMVRSWPDHRRYPILSPFDRSPHDPGTRRRALRWYHSQFPLPRPGRKQLFYEATPEYLYFPRTAELIRGYRPDMKLVVLLRDPVERAYSAWNMHRAFTEPDYVQLRDDRPFEEAIRQELATLGTVERTAKADYVRRGIYHEQLARYLRHFPGRQMLILESGELRRTPAATVRRVCRFLDIPDLDEEFEFAPVFSGRYAEAMPDAANRLLRNFYAPHNARLFELIGRKFDWAEGEPAPRRSFLRESVGPFADYRAA
jgi:hypothetical protein